MPAAPATGPVALAEKYLGIPYVYGGTSPKGFDCSGLMQYVYRQLGVSLPRTSQEQAKSGVAVQYANLAPGDLIFSNWGDGADSHVAMYAGGGKLIEAPRPGKSVQLVAFNDYYRQHVDGYRRVASTSGSGGVEQVGILGDITGGLGDVAGGIANGLTGGVSGLLSFPGEIIDFFKGATSAVEGSVKFLGLFFQPSTYVRIGAGVGGLLFLSAGMTFLIVSAAKKS